MLEGETADPADCITIGRAVLRDLPELPKGHPLEVILEYESNGRLNVRLIVAGTDRTLEMELQRGDSLTSRRVVQWKDAIASGGGFDAFDEMLQAVLGIDEK